MSILSIFEIIFWLLRLFTGARISHDDDQDDHEAKEKHAEEDIKQRKITPTSKVAYAEKEEGEDYYGYGQYYAPRT